MAQIRAPWGVGIFEEGVSTLNTNVTYQHLTSLIQRGRQVRMFPSSFIHEQKILYDEAQPSSFMFLRTLSQVRQASWCVTVMVVSSSVDFLEVFGSHSLDGRLLVWTTKLLVLTTISRTKLKYLFSNSYTYTQMNAMVITERKHKTRRK